MSDSSLVVNIILLQPYDSSIVDNTIFIRRAVSDSSLVVNTIFIQPYDSNTAVKTIFIQPCLVVNIIPLGPFYMSIVVNTPHVTKVRDSSLVNNNIFMYSLVTAI